MKPLFDSEDFAFIASADDRLSVWCRRCDDQALAEVHINPIRLRTMCKKCGRTQIYAIANAVFAGSNAQA